MDEPRLPTWGIETADVMEWASNYTGEPFMAILCDPPYELSFMGRNWDRSGISFNPETWAALAEHLHPGAFGMAFASSRGWHRLAVAIEDAGLRIHPSIFGWAYGSGFPKATRIDSQVDQAAGRIGESILALKRQIRERYEITGMTLAQFNDACGFEASGYLRESSTWAGVLPSREKWQCIKAALKCNEELDSLFDEAERTVVGKSDAGLHRGSGTTVAFGKGNSHDQADITAPATPLAQAWQGHRYGLQALKPALEPIIVFQKPYEGKPVDCITETGAGVLWIDGGRIAAPTWNRGTPTIDDMRGDNYGRSGGKRLEVGPQEGHPQGRWPANFCLVHHPDCERVGEKRVSPGPGAGSGVVGDTTNSPETRTVYGDYATIQQRGFSHADPDGLETVADWRCVPECPVRRLGEQSGESKSSGSPIRQNGSSWKCANQHGVYDRICDKGTAARFFHQSDWSYEIAERLAMADPVMYCAKAAKKEREAGLFGIIPCVQCGGLTSEAHENEHGRTVACRRSGHPTIKPITLARWLATLLLPPAEYAPRRILIPFSGTMSEGIGAMLAGWDEIVGIEMDEGYCEIGEARMRFWQSMARETGLSDPHSILKVQAKKDKKKKAGNPQQLELING